jgi:hypothetical protein
VVATPLLLKRAGARFLGGVGEDRVDACDERGRSRVEELLLLPGSRRFDFWMSDEEVVAVVEDFDEGLCGNGKVGFGSAVCAVAAGFAATTAAAVV